MRWRQALTPIVVIACATCGGWDPPAEGGAQADPPHPLFPELGNTGYDAEHYTLKLAVDLPSNHIDGVLTMQAVALQSLSSFNLDLWKLKVDSVEVNNRKASFSHKGMELRVLPAEPLAEGGRFEAVVHYQGTPKSIKPAVDLGWTRYDEGVLIAHGLGTSTTWYPNNADRTDLASFTLEVEVPAEHKAVASGQLVAVYGSGDRSTFVWQVSQPIYSDGLIINIGRFQERTLHGLDGLPIKIYHPPGLTEQNFGGVGQAVEIAEFLTTVFGPFPYPTLSFTLLDRSIGGAAVAYSEPMRIVTKPEPATSTLMVVHEITHQWVGNSVVPGSVRDWWLAEGIATYAEVLWWENEQGPEKARELIEEFHTAASQSGAPPLDPIVDSSVVHEAVYERGALVLHALRNRVGDEVFFDLLKGFVQQLLHSTVTTEDFIQVAEDVSGEDLSEFFDPWLRAEAVPPLP